MTERTLIMIKPGAVRRGLIGEVISRIERKGLRIGAVRMLRFDKALADRFYEEHLEKPFYPTLLDFITSGPAVALVVEGENAIQVMRLLMGATHYLNAPPGTIRGDLAHDATANVVHGSDSPASARREIELLFPDDARFSP